MNHLKDQFNSGYPHLREQLNAQIRCRPILDQFYGKIWLGFNVEIVDQVYQRLQDQLEDPIDPIWCENQ